MTDHLSPRELNALTDGELSSEQLAVVSEHLAGCAACTSSALSQSLLKSATARAGRRYAPQEELRERILLNVREAADRVESGKPNDIPVRGSRTGLLGWAATAAILLIAMTGFVFQRNAQRTQIAAAEFAAMVTEVSDQHIAALAATAPPEVISSDRHTVKPWFQGKLPFSFNLPEDLPADAKLDGANLTYIHNQPVAQLLYSIGKHRVSVFVAEGQSPLRARNLTAEHEGFHVMAMTAGDAEIIAVSDVDPARLSDLLHRIGQVQTGTHSDVR